MKIRRYSPRLFILVVCILAAPGVAWWWHAHQTEVKLLAPDAPPHDVAAAQPVNLAPYTRPPFFVPLRPVPLAVATPEAPPAVPSPRGILETPLWFVADMAHGDRDYGGLRQAADGSLFYGSIGLDVMLPPRLFAAAYYRRSALLVTVRRDGVVQCYLQRGGAWRQSERFTPEYTSQTRDVTFTRIPGRLDVDLHNVDAEPTPWPEPTPQPGFTAQPETQDAGYGWSGSAQPYLKSIACAINLPRKCALALYEPARDWQVRPRYSNPYHWNEVCYRAGARRLEISAAPDRWIDIALPAPLITESWNPLFTMRQRGGVYCQTTAGWMLFDTHGKLKTRFRDTTGGMSFSREKGMRTCARFDDATGEIITAEQYTHRYGDEFHRW